MCRTWRVITRLVGRAQLAVGRSRLLDDLDGVQDRRQRVAQLVGQHGQELVLAPVGVPQLLLGPLPLGDVLAGADHADRLARRASFSKSTQECSTAPSRPAARSGTRSRTARPCCDAAVDGRADDASRSSGWMSSKNVALSSSREPGSNPKMRKVSADHLHGPGGRGRPALVQLHLPASDVRRRLRALEHLLALAERALGGFPIGHIVDQHDDAANASVRIAMRDERDVALVERSVLDAYLILEGHRLARQRAGQVRTDRTPTRLPRGRRECVCRGSVRSSGRTRGCSLRCTRRSAHQRRCTRAARGRRWR